MTVRTVGELKKALKEYPDDMPLWIVASCYTHGDNKVYSQILPDIYCLGKSEEMSDGGEVVEIQSPGVSVYSRNLEARNVKKGKSGKWKTEYREWLCIANSDPEEMRLLED